MSAVIQRLSEQARAAVTAGLPVEDWIKEYNQRLARLLIMECAGIYDCIDNGNLHSGTDNYILALQRHFGFDQ